MFCSARTQNSETTEASKATMAQKLPSTQSLTTTTENITATMEANSSLHSEVTTDSTTTYQSYQYTYRFRGIIRVFALAYNMFLLVFGIPGNLLAVVVLLRKECQKIPGSIFLVVITLADVLAILSNQFFGYWFFLMFDISLQYATNFSCKLMSVCYIFSSDLSKCCLLAFSFERFLSICFPLKSRGLISQKRRIQFIIILNMVLVLFIVHDMLFWNLDLTPDGPKCRLVGVNFLIKIRYVFSSVFSVFPGVAMLIFNISIISVLVRRANLWNKRQNNTKKENMSVSAFSSDIFTVDLNYTVFT